MVNSEGTLLALAAMTLDFRTGPPRQEQTRRVTLEVQPDKPGAANPTTPEDTARTHFGAAAFGCQGLRYGDDESSNLTLRHRVSGAKQRSFSLIGLLIRAHSLLY